jgi:hypothetical protein
MKSRWTPLLIVLVFACSLAATLVSRSKVAATRPTTVWPVAAWLGLSAEQEATIRRQDPDFTRDLEDAREKLDQERARLAGLFEQGNATDQELRSQIEAVIVAGNSLEHRVADHLIHIRRHLTSDQQKRLFGLCAQSVRQCCRASKDGGCAAGGACPQAGKWGCGGQAGGACPHAGAGSACSP